jgi:hypothetical protein
LKSWNAPPLTSRDPDCAACELALTHHRKQEERPMNTQSKRSVFVATLAILLACASRSRAQLSNYIPAAPQQAAQTLTGGQQTAANSALCSAIGSHIPNPASAGPSALSNPAVMSAAASSFAGSTKLPMSSATDLLKGYVSRHATDILASCAASNATGGLTSKLPGAGSLTSIPKMP